MRLVYLSNARFGEEPEGRRQLEARRRFLNEAASPGTVVDIVDNPEAAASVESAEDELRAITGTLANARRCQHEGCDALITGCFGDPGLDVVREVARVPVASPGLSSLHLAAQLGLRFGVLTPVAATVPLARRQAEAAGLGRRLVGVRALDLPVLQIRSDRQRALVGALDAARLLVRRDGADTLILGCMSMAFGRFDADITAALGVPVINPAIVAVRMAELLVAAGLRHSPLVYAAAAGPPAEGGGEPGDDGGDRG